MMKGCYCPENDKLSIAVMADEKAKGSDCHGSHLMSVAAGSFGIMDGLTEFVPWTGFDYSSDCEGDDDEIEDTLPVSGAAKKKRKRANQKQPSADADIIATATEENLRKLGIDPNSNEGKKQRRKIRNRLSAQLHRERKKGYISYLEGLVRERDAKLLSVSADFSRLNMEVEKLRKVVVTSRNVDDNIGYSSGAGHTDSDAGDDSDTVSISSEVNGSSMSPPMTPVKGFTMGTRFKGSKIGSAFSLFSAVLMISITIFGPHFQSANHVLLDSDGAPRDASISSTLSIGDSEGYNLKISDPHSLEVDAHNKQLIPSIHGRSLLASVTPQPPPSLTDVPIESEESKHFSQDVAKSLIHSSRVRFNSQSVISSNSQALWHFHDHVTDLYPSYLPYYSPDLDPSRNQTPSCHKVRVTSRKNLRAREDRNGTYPVISGREELQSGQPGQLQRRYDTRTLKSSHETEDTDNGDMGKTLVSVVPGSSLKQSPAATSTSTPTTTRLTGQPAIDYNTDSSTSTSPSSAKYSSVSRVLLTQGRALLDPSLVIPLEVDKSKNNVVPTNKGKTATDTFLKTLSTWTGAGTGGWAADDPPVVRVGINTMGSSPVDPSSPNNMLVLLLPASAVRWGKNWQESSDGTMDAMLKGLNFSEGSYGKTDEGEPDSTVEEGMWVEIGCSVIKAQLVRNVTLSS
jgi:bZIP transcription factor